MTTRHITGVILAGGKGRRLNGQDKGWVELVGQPLVQYVIAGLAPQVDHILINANRNQDRYRALGYTVVDDPIADYAGPLAGFAAAMATAPDNLILTAPCDAPRVPRDLAARLHAAMDAQQASIAVAHDGQRLQPVHALIDSRLLPDLRIFLDEGGRKIDSWYARHNFVKVDFSDQTAAFNNINDAEQLAAFEQEIRNATA